MPGGPGSGVLQIISVFMLILDVIKAILIPFILFRGIVLINVLIKKYKVNKNESKTSKLSAVSEKPVEPRAEKKSETVETVETTEVLEDEKEK